MDLDAGYIYTLLRDKDSRGLSAIEKNWLIGDWSKVYDFCLECLTVPGMLALPSLGTIADRFGVSFDKTEEPMGFFVSEIKKRQACTALDNAVRTHAIPYDAQNPLNSVEKLISACAEIKRRYHSTTSGQSINYSCDIEYRLSGYKKRKEMNGVVGIPFPYSPMNTCTGGLIGGELSVVLAESGVGKTWFLCLIARSAFLGGRSVLFVSQEMQPLRLCNRLDSLLAGISPDRMLRGCLTDQEEKRLCEHYDSLKERKGKLNIYGQKDVNSLASFEALLSVMHSQVDIILWDSPYLAIRSETWEERAEFVRCLKANAEMYNLPIVISWQLNREGKAALTVAVVTDADHNFVLEREKNMGGASQMKVYSTKTRDGVELRDMYLNWDVVNGDFSLLCWKGEQLHHDYGVEIS